MKLAHKLGTGFIVIGAGLCYLGIRAKSLNLYLFLIGGALAAVGLGLVFITGQKAEKQAHSAFNEWKNKLINYGQVIPVNFEDCEVKSNQYREEIDDDLYHPYKVLEGLLPSEDPEYNTVHQQVIVYQTDYKGKPKTFLSPTIHKDEISLQFILAKQVSTKIYVDQLDSNNYYFDLTFLLEKE